LRRTRFAVVQAGQKGDPGRKTAGKLADVGLLERGKALPHVAVCQFDAAAIPGPSFLAEAQTVCRWRSTEISLLDLFWQWHRGA
jgi:hypothetical protein